MKKNLYYFLITSLLLVLHSVVSQAQIKSFGKEPDVFKKELKKLMSYDKIASAEAAFKNFEPVWDSISTDKYKVARIIKNADRMLEKRMRASPHFELYLNTLAAFYRSGYMDERFVMWQKMFETYYTGKTKEMQDFLEVSYLLFSSNILYQTHNSRLWKADNSNFSFDMINGQPTVVFEKLTLSCVTRADSLVIHDTKGSYSINSYEWKGSGGKVDWTRGELDQEEVFATLNSYNMNLSGNEYHADSVSFINKKYFDSPVVGRLHDIALATSNPETARYPKFFTYDLDFQIDDFSKDVTYHGGFSQQGRKVIGYGEGANLGTFLFTYKDKPFITLKAEEFIVTDDRIVTDKATITINLDSNGNIFHPQVNINYVIADRTLNALRGSEGVSRSPFVDTYHNMEIKADKVQWIIDQPKINMETIQKDGSVVMYSKNFFREFDYEKLQGLQAYNPLARIKAFCEKTGKTTFHLSEYVDYLNSKREYVRFQVVVLGDEGYLTIDSKTDTVRVNEKLFNAVNAHMGRTDYDVIFFESIIEKRANVSINLENYNMELEGVGRFFFSDSQYVYVIPTEQQVTVRKDRELIFNGKVRAGRFEFFGNGMRFDYKLFKVDMDAIDSLRFFFPDENENLKKVHSVIQDLTGTLYIDQPNNKSGRKPFPEYPIFKATKGSKVYYDYPYIFGGVYNREDFYFHNDPFIIDSLDNFTREGLRFPGTFVSADIFPDFREELGLQEDNSLGFKKEVNMPSYKGAGQSRVNLHLSNQGLLAKGEIDYATSLTKSQNIVYFPDSMNAESESFDLAKSSIYPEIHGKGVHTHWKPYEDRMSQFSKDSPFSIFDNAKLTGEFRLSKTGSGAHGKLDFNDAEITSNQMAFDPMRMKADTSNLVIKSIDPNKFAFRATNVKSDVDFTSLKGDFKSNVNTANTEFPYNQYMSSLNEFTWDIKKKKINFRTPVSKPIESTYFVSTHPDQDSLRFSSREALYDLNDYTLYINQIPHIDVADSRIFPDSGKAIVRAGAAMDPLKNAKISMDTANKWHNFYNANVGIMGRYNFGADAYYDYTDKSGKKNVAYFHEIKVDYLKKTAIAKANVYDTMGFTITPRFEFKGELTVTGEHKGVDFNGHVHPMHTMGRPPSGWWRDRGIYSPENVVFNISSPINEVKKPLKLGYFITFDSVHVYPAFFTLGRNYSDSALLKIEEGVVYYDDAQEKFYAGNLKKIKGDTNAGNYIYLDDKNGIMYGEGNTQLGVNLGAFGIKTAGNITYFGKDSSIDLNLMMLLDFKLPDEAIQVLTAKMEENRPGMPSVDNKRPMVKKALAEWLGEKDLEKALEQISFEGTIPVNKETKATIFISEIKMTWNQNRKAFVSQGPIGITAMGESKVEYQVEGKMEIKRKRSGDEITFYFETDNNHWYYMNFVRRNMYIYSSEDDFNKAVRDNYEKVSGGDYILKLASPRAKIRFLGSFDKNEPESEEEENSNQED